MKSGARFPVRTLGRITPSWVEWIRVSSKSSTNILCLTATETSIIQKSSHSTESITSYSSLLHSAYQACRREDLTTWQPSWRVKRCRVFCITVYFHWMLISVSSKNWPTWWTLVQRGWRWRPEPEKPTILFAIQKSGRKFRQPFSLKLFRRLISYKNVICLTNAWKNLGRFGAGFGSYLVSKFRNRQS